MSEAELPKQDLLLKMLRMTESDNDGTALVAIRKANALLVQNGWSWEKLLKGKITVIEDPFSAQGRGNFDPFANRAASPPPAAPTTPYRPQRTSPKAQPAQPSATAWQAPPRPQPAPSGMNYASTSTGRMSSGPSPKPASRLFPVVDSTKSNKYPNTCYCCGDAVVANAGWIFNPSAHNTSAIDKWEVICTPCNSATTLAVPNRKAKPKAAAWSNVSLNDL